ncbi:MAG: SPOR domain-containing protein [Pseudomonadota bacterium]
MSIKFKHVITILVAIIALVLLILPMVWYDVQQQKTVEMYLPSPPLAQTQQYAIDNNVRKSLGIPTAWLGFWQTIMAQFSGETDLQAKNSLVKAINNAVQSSYLSADELKAKQALKPVWFIQTSTFSQRQQAEALLAKLRTLQISAFVIQLKQRWFAVLIGPITHKNDIKKLSDMIGEKFNIKGTVIKFTVGDFSFPSEVVQ